MDIDFIDLTGVREDRTHLCLDFCRKAFLEWVYNHRDKELYIIIPPKGNIENYVFSLESTMTNLFNVSIINNKFHYVLGNNILEEIPTFTDYVIMDPLCYLYECNRIYDIVKEVRGRLNKV